MARAPASTGPVTPGCRTPDTPGRDGGRWGEAIGALPGAPVEPQSRGPARRSLTGRGSRPGPQGVSDRLWTGKSKYVAGNGSGSKV